jgi:hypothetical protein
MGSEQIYMELKLAGKQHLAKPFDRVRNLDNKPLLHVTEFGDECLIAKATTKNTKH